MVMASHQAFKTHTDPPVNPVKHPLSCTHQPSPSATPPGACPRRRLAYIITHPADPQVNDSWASARRTAPNLLPVITGGLSVFPRPGRGGRSIRRRRPWWRPARLVSGSARAARRVRAGRSPLDRCHHRFAAAPRVQARSLRRGPRQRNSESMTAAVDDHRGTALEEAFRCRADLGEPVDTQVHLNLDDPFKVALEACDTTVTDAQPCSDIRRVRRRNGPAHKAPCHILPSEKNCTLASYE